MTDAPWRFTPIVFDAYGTLFDPGAVAVPLELKVPGRGVELAAAWRATQLRHTWLRTLTGTFVDFDTVTRHALGQVLQEAGLSLDAGAIEELLAHDRTLPPYPEVVSAVTAIEADWPMAILTNGTQSTVETMVRAAGLAERIPTVLSVDVVRAYKPSPQVYRMASDHFGVDPSAVHFVSGNPWDCAGAAAFGLRAIRLRRGSAADDERIGPPPAATIDDLTGLAAVLR
ncbi:MAG TPA: haloacid dehalogenase type II [Candidatus Saccharimonadales bacterium]|nr:haloacid dehalogenase type II [Candidatus Saccharimonadales bacterium]